MKFKKLSDENLEEISQLLKAFSDVTRLKIMRYLHERERCVGDIVKVVESGQANISKHLQLLAKVGVLKSRKEGNTVFYRVADPAVDQLCESICGGYQTLMENKYKSLFPQMKIKKRVS